MPLEPDLSPARHLPAPMPAADWQRQLPVLTGRRAILRPLQPTDATALLTMVGSAEVGRFISPPPTTLDGFRRFIDWSAAEQREGRHVCYGVVPRRGHTTVGLFQVRSLESGFGVAEWGFALGSAFWGTGLFLEAAQLVLGFTFDVLGTFRLEARAAVENGRGNGALRKLGAVEEGVLRRSFLRCGRYHDQMLWVLLSDERTPPLRLR
ncbi:MAG: GNAT family N-acetyltransferase [Acidobacteriota bacterium]|nr:GNAT family N-acetyltransferase [Acidobacteriota bacterium]